MSVVAVVVTVSSANSVIILSFGMASRPRSTGISDDPLVMAAAAAVVVSSSEDVLFLVKKPGSGGSPCKFVVVERRIIIDAAFRKGGIGVVIVVVVGVVVNECVISGSRSWNRFNARSDAAKVEFFIIDNIIYSIDTWRFRVFVTAKR